MNTTKLQEALEEMKTQRATLDDGIAAISKVIASLSGVEDDDKRDSGDSSYIDQAAEVIREAGKPLHVTEIAERISHRIGNPIARGAFEGSLIRHINKAKAPKLVKSGPSTYGIPEGHPLLAVAE